MVKENLLLKPDTFNITSIGKLEGYTHQATLIYMAEETNIDRLTSEVVDDLAMQKDIAFGVSALPVNGLIIRLLGYKAEQLFALVKGVATRFKTFVPHVKREAYVA